MVHILFRRNPLKIADLVVMFIAVNVVYIPLIFGIGDERFGNKRMNHFDFAMTEMHDQITAVVFDGRKDF